MELNEVGEPDRERPAVSEVVGSLILVGFTMIGIVLVGLLLLANQPATKVPSVNLIISNQSGTIFIYHKGGDPLSSDQFRILVDGGDQTPNFTLMSPGTWPWSVGETLSNVSPNMPARVVVILNMTSGGETILASAGLSPAVNVLLHPLSPPSVAWSINPPLYSNISTPFHFTESTTGTNITDYYWDLGDGNTSTTQNIPDHTFPCDAGSGLCTYSIGHSATDSKGTEWESTTWLNRSITVYENLTPTVTFTQDRTSGPAGCLVVGFDATQVGGIKIDEWAWNFGDSGTSSDEDPSHPYATQGTYTVTLTARNSTLGVTTVTKSNLIQVTTSWYNCNWLYRKLITIDHIKVQTADQANFPVLINMSLDSDLQAHARTDGFDILFTDSTGTAKLSHENEYYQSGVLTAWVKVNPLSSSTDTLLFMYYGNPGSSSSQEDVANVWSNNYGAVWHFRENPAGTAPQMKDSKNTNHGTSGGSMTSTDQVGGKVDGGLDFDKDDDRIEMADASSIRDIFSSGGTFSAWIKPVDIGENSEGRIGDKSSNTQAKNGWSFATYTNNVLMFRKGFSTTDGRGGYWRTASSSVSMGSWNYVVVTYNSGSTSNDPTIYINGNSVGITEVQAPASGYSASSDNGYVMRIGQTASAYTRTFNGVIDEIHASKTIRDANWIKTEWNNQNNPGVGGFIKTLGSQETSA